MATYDVQQRIKLIGVFYSSERSIIETQRKYRQHFNVRVSPSDNMIRKELEQSAIFREGGLSALCHWRCTAVSLRIHLLCSTRHRQNIASEDSETGFKNVPTGWSYCAHCQGDDGPPARNFRWTNNLKKCWICLASEFTWFVGTRLPFVNKPRTIQELKENIRAETPRLRPETLRTVMENAVERALIVSRKMVVIWEMLFSHIMLKIHWLYFQIK
jgi:hypothetical protein